VVTAPGGELAEVIADGVTGRVSPSNAAEPFAATVLSVLAAPAEARRMGAAAREFVLEAFSADVMIRKLEALYIELLETTSGSTEGAAAQG
jgi:glycosyltransferase involved in cell wall biosynthesis